MNNAKIIDRINSAQHQPVFSEPLTPVRHENVQVSRKGRFTDVSNRSSRANGSDLDRTQQLLTFVKVWV